MTLNKLKFESPVWQRSHGGLREKISPVKNTLQKQHPTEEHVYERWRIVGFILPSSKETILTS